MNRSIREQLAEIVQNLLPDVPTLIEKLSADQKLSYLARLLPFVCAPAQPETDSQAAQEAAASAIAEKVYEKMLVHTGAQIAAQKEAEADYRYNQ